MKLRALLLYSVVCMGAFAEDLPKSGEHVEVIKVSMEGFPTSVRKQLTKAGVLATLEAAESITVQLISSPDDQNLTENGRIAEQIIRPESKKIVLTSEQRGFLLAALSEDTTYLESMASCLCFFTPQLRVTFESRVAKKHFDVFLSGVSHGEIQVIECGCEIACARTWRFIPQYLAFLGRMFPNHATIRMLHEYHEQRLKDLADQPLETTPSAVTPGAAQPARQP